jgi:galactokinase
LIVEEDMSLHRGLALLFAGVTFLGAGVGGETVALKADAKNPAVQERLKAEFNRR